MKKITVFLMLLISYGPQVKAERIDCTLDSSALIPHLICSDPELLELDNEVQDTYDKWINEEKQSLKYEPDKRNVKAIKELITWLTKNQSAWEKKRNACTTKGCLKKLYKQRIQWFEEQTYG
jgi:uncharacterized protein